MSPRITACVPWYRPQSRAPKVALMMKATMNERRVVRRIAVLKARSVDSPKRTRLAVFLEIALHHRHGVQHLRGDRARVGHPVLAGARQATHPPADEDRRQDDQHQDRQHLRHHHRVGDDQHGHRADAHHRVAQAHREARADDRLHQRRVGGEARQHLAGLGGLEELRALPHDVRIDGVAQVGGDPLAEPAHHVEAGRREQAEGDADAEQGDEMLAHRHHPRARIGADEALVDQAAQRHRKDQGAGRREHQEQHRQRDPAAVGAQEGQQARQRSARRAPRAAGTTGTGRAFAAV